MLIFFHIHVLPEAMVANQVANAARFDIYVEREPGYDFQLWKIVPFELEPQIGENLTAGSLPFMPEVLTLGFECKLDFGFGFSTA
jgi:hypothetical protein